MHPKNVVDGMLVGIDMGILILKKDEVPSETEKILHNRAGNGNRGR